MAVVKYGLVITEIKGKVGGQVLQGGNRSKILRNNSNKKNSKSSALNNATNKLVAVTSQFKLLSAIEHAAWVTAASQWPFTDKYSTIYFGSAFQCFTAYNRNLLTLNLPITYTPNVPSPATDVSPFIFTSSTVANITITPTTVLLTSQFWNIYASPCYSKGRNNNNAQFKLIDSLDMIGQSSYRATTPYSNVYGPPKLNSKIIFKIVQVNPAYPFQYFPTVLSTIIT